MKMFARPWSGPRTVAQSTPVPQNAKAASDRARSEVATPPRDAALSFDVPRKVSAAGSTRPSSPPRTHPTISSATRTGHRSRAEGERATAETSAKPGHPSRRPPLGRRREEREGPFSGPSVLRLAARSGSVPCRSAGGAGSRLLGLRRPRGRCHRCRGNLDNRYKHRVVTEDAAVVHARPHPGLPAAPLAVNVERCPGTRVCPEISHSRAGNDFEPPASGNMMPRLGWESTR
jgi:hypothetical protein